METNNDLTATIERLAAAATLLEETVSQLAERQRETEVSIGRISAAVESTLEERLAMAEARIAELTAAGSTNSPAQVTNTRKTLPLGMTTLLSKQGVTIDSIEAGALDAALANLSIEQRIAVKSQLLRAGLLG